MQERDVATESLVRRLHYVYFQEIPEEFPGQQKQVGLGLARS
jgi:hypothetical protein